MRWSIGALFLLALSACAGMDVSECRTADWRAIGFEDGAQGQSPGYFGERRKSCADHGITADFDAYLAGRAEGLSHFCSPYNGYRLGTQGYQYSGICPARLEDAFLTAHADGYGLYKRHTALKRIQKRVHRSKKRAQEIEYLLAERTALLVSSDTKTPERAAIAVELKQLVEEKVQLEEIIHRLEYDHAEAEREYERYQDHIASRQKN